MKLQLALDDVTLQEGLTLLENVQESVDIIEVGTPMVIAYGMEAVRRIKERFPNKEILADLKIMDAGYYEAKEALEAGADYITVLGVTDDRTISGCVEAAREFGGKCVVDMICVREMKERIRVLEALGADYVSVHVGVDQQAAGRTPLDDLKLMKEAVTCAKVSVAGGICAASLLEYCRLQPDIIIVGSGITHAKDPKKEAEAICQSMKESAS